MLATGDVADRVEPFVAVYGGTPCRSGRGVYGAVRQFTDYGLAFIARSTHLGVTPPQVTQWLRGSSPTGSLIKAWLSDHPVENSPPSSGRCDDEACAPGRAGAGR